MPVNFTVHTVVVILLIYPVADGHDHIYKAVCHSLSMNTSTTVLTSQSYTAMYFYVHINMYVYMWNHTP